MIRALGCVNLPRPKVNGHGLHYASAWPRYMPSYPDFETDPHPVRRHAITIDLATGKARHTDYARNLNPPILHRKEAFLPADHGRLQRQAA